MVKRKPVLRLVTEDHVGPGVRKHRVLAREFAPHFTEYISRKGTNVHEDSPVVGWWGRTHDMGCPETAE